ncbi:kynurenine formamidase isoform X2 [Dunckerocampus dactyliophorus]|uniref:kynurenine formamidase isoform X2 n=1 Tax=Dunckerocampus dactyliophorus TaxID=161453 RepID=UPI002406FFBA|nr:kynurenine formamidase isoform X2 [Dunckerocampus dactyliophorus]
MMMHWTAMKKDELEKQYSPSRWSHRMAADDVIKAHVKAVKEGTERARGLAQTLLNVPYGEGDGERLDAYIPSTNSLVRRSQDSWPCRLLVKVWWWLRSATTLLPEVVALIPVVFVYVKSSIVQYVKMCLLGNMDLMVSQVRKSVVSVVQQYSHISGLYLCGHSAGAHLAAMVLSTDWSQYSITPQIKGAFLVSGIYDLLPILSTYVNEPLKMTEEVAIRNSPSKLIPQLKLSSSCCQIVVAVAENDSPEFRKQSEYYYKALKSTGQNVTMEDVPNTDHFSIIEQLVDEEYHLVKLLLKMMGKS